MSTLGVLRYFHGHTKRYFMMTSWHGNAFHITASGDFYSTGASNAVLNFCLGLPEQAVEKPVEFPTI